MTTLSSLLLILAQGQGIPQGGTPALPSNPNLRQEVAGPERTGAEVTSEGRTLRVKIARASAETNATQLTLRNSAAVEKGDTLLASMYVRGTTPKGTPAQAYVMFERASSPWEKSASESVTTLGATRWRRVLLPFASTAAYGPGEAMLSVRLAFGPQTVELRDIEVTNYRRTQSVEALRNWALTQQSLGDVKVQIDATRRFQKFEGLGGNFCQPRYGRSEPLDRAGRMALAELNVRHARIGIPLEVWSPEPGRYADSGPAHASFLALQELGRRKIPIVASIWECPLWMTGGQREQSGRILPPERYSACADAITAYLTAARDNYGVEADYVSFNEPDLGINIRFSSKTMGDFILVTGPKFRAAGLKTKFIVADTANGLSLPAYAEPLLQDARLKPYLGPIGFHSWDALSASRESYLAIAAVGRKYGKPVWCLEAGHDPQLWQTENPWDSWENALRTAVAYAITIRLSGASVMDYWTYQDNYPLVEEKSGTRYPVFHVMRQMAELLRPGSTVCASISDSPDLETLAVNLPGSGGAGFLLVNRSGPGSAGVSGLERNRRVQVVTSTPGAQSNVSVRRTDASGWLRLPLAARAVVTVRQLP